MIFVGGATGATGQDFVAAALEQGVDLRVHVRPQSVQKFQDQHAQAPSPSVFDLSDAPALHQAMQGCRAVVSMIGTMKQRFSSGDTYESSDVGTTRLLVDAAKAAGVEHFVLLSSLGAGTGMGAYLRAKRQAERIVMDSGLRWSVARPSALVGNGRAGKSALSSTAWMRHLGGVGQDLRSIPTSVLARALLKVAVDVGPEGVLMGRQLWALGADSRG